MTYIARIFIILTLLTGFLAFDADARPRNARVAHHKARVERKIVRVKHRVHKMERKMHAKHQMAKKMVKHHRHQKQG